jgi:hypothetical protein
MEAHGLGAILLSHATPAADLIQLGRSLATDRGPGGSADAFDRRLRDGQVSGLLVVTAAADKVTTDRRAISVEDAVERADGARAGRPAGAGFSTDRPEFGQMMESVNAAGLSLSGAIGLLRSQPDSPGVPQVLNVVVSGIREAMQGNRWETVVDALSAMLQCEGELPEGPTRKHYSLALARILVDEVLRPLARFVQDPLYAKDVGLIMERAGSLGTQHLLQALVSAPTFAERKTLLDVLRRMTDGTEMVVAMLRQPDWFVVRNVSDLAGLTGRRRGA